MISFVWSHDSADYHHNIIHSLRHSPDILLAELDFDPGIFDWKKSRFYPDQCCDSRKK